MNWMFKRPQLFRRMLNLWAPMLFSGIKVTRLDNDFRSATTRLKLTFWNKNAVGTQYGGSIFSMTDPMYMLMLSAALGKRYWVWDKQADIEFVNPGKGTLYADFVITDDLLNSIKKHTENDQKYLPEIMVLVKDSEGNLVAKVKRVLYIRHKPKYRADK